MTTALEIETREVKGENHSVITLNVRLAADLREDSGVWIAWCRSLNVATQADARDAALRSLEEAVRLWFESCVERGVLEDALAEVGFQKLGPEHPVPDGASFVAVQLAARPSREEKSGVDYIEVSIPAYIAARQLSDLCATR